MPNKRVVCERCDRVFEVLDSDRFDLAINPDRYVCNTCKMGEDKPRNMLSQHVQTVQPWDYCPDQKCQHCGEFLWVHGFYDLRDSEVQVSGDSLIKPAKELIHHFECPNPACPMGWGKVPGHENIPKFLAPPWAVIPQDTYEMMDLSSMPIEEQGPFWHQTWYETWKKEQANVRNAGKGTPWWRRFLPGGGSTSEGGGKR